MGEVGLAIIKPMQSKAFTAAPASKRYDGRPETPQTKKRRVSTPGVSWKEN
jgi:hypothetical protein